MRRTRAQQRRARRELNYYLTILAMFLTAVVLPLPLIDLFLDYFTLPVSVLFSAIITSLVIGELLWAWISLIQ